MQFFTLIAPLCMLALTHLPIFSAADVIAFSGTLCDGNAGANVPCDGGCIAFSGRQSFEVVASGLHCVTVYQDTNCHSLIGTFPNQGDSRCQNVNTGTAVGSFRCSSTDTCSN